MTRNHRCARVSALREAATRIACFLVFVFAASTGAAEDLSLSGKVVRAIDGDTIEVLDVQLVTHRVRLAGIDAAESGQDYGTKAKQRLLKLVGRRDVQVLSTKRDKYGRIVGKVIADDQDVNLAMIRTGAAWWYRKIPGRTKPSRSGALRGSRGQGPIRASGAVGGCPRHSALGMEASTTDT